MQDSARKHVPVIPVATTALWSGIDGAVSYAATWYDAAEH
jgi:hypothetical protein